MSETTGLRRPELYPGPVIDGRPADGAARRLQRRIERLLISRGERGEAELEAALAHQLPVSHANVVALISPKDRVGNTTCTFVIGSLLADRLRLRIVAVDANPDHGTLAALAPDQVRCQRSLADLLTDIEQIETTSQLRRYVSALPSGLHLLGAPNDATVMARLGREAYGELLALLSTFYELVLLDLGTRVAGELGQFAISRADQAVLVTTPEWVTSPAMLAALEHLDHDHTVVAANKFFARGPADLRELERRLRERGLDRSVAIPHDEQLATMLNTATYQLEALQRTSRMAIKRLGLAVTEQLV